MDKKIELSLQEKKRTINCMICYNTSLLKIL